MTPYPPWRVVAGNSRTDFSTKSGAEYLAGIIRHAWHSVGATNVKVWTEPKDLLRIRKKPEHGKDPEYFDRQYVIQSNLVNGMPPHDKTTHETKTTEHLLPLDRVRDLINKIRATEQHLDMLRVAKNIAIAELADVMGNVEAGRRIGLKPSAIRAVRTRARRSKAGRGS